jgi:GNAT superfamily N-acetyltransferase
MKISSLTDPSQIESLLRRDTPLNIYGLGDLDEPFRRHARWFGLGKDLALLYTGLSEPTLLLLTPARELLTGLIPLLSRKLYAHLHPGLADILAAGYSLRPGGAHLKMALRRPERLSGIDCSSAQPLADADELLRFYDEAYPGHWFAPQTSAIGPYFGMRREGRLIAAGGVHVHSPRYKVAALGNIAVRPDCRGQGLGRLVTAAVCHSLLRTVEHIGLNVKADNVSAIACYKSLGFATHASYEEYAAQARP